MSYYLFITKIVTYKRKEIILSKFYMLLQPGNVAMYSMNYVGEPNPNVTL